MGNYKIIQLMNQKEMLKDALIMARSKKQKRKIHQQLNAVRVEIRRLEKEHQLELKL